MAGHLIEFRQTDHIRGKTLSNKLFSQIARPPFRLAWAVQYRSVEMQNHLGQDNMPDRGSSNRMKIN